MFLAAATSLKFFWDNSAVGKGAFFGDENYFGISVGRICSTK